ncbi:MAG: YlmC/YmxH family sporulation protein [Clostridia bacterium]|nr:YlmC/YmxH family sporulation protein [Clostridia bacterium]
MTLAELREKDVINTRDGRSLGRVIDVEICLCDGRITAIIVPGEARPFSTARFGHMLRGERAGIVIPWEMICKIGDDVILVDVEVC